MLLGLQHFGGRGVCWSSEMGLGQTRTHKTHHDPDLREATTFPLIVFSVLGHEVSTQMPFCLRIPKWESRNFRNGTPRLWRPIILCVDL
jgi:hypothetical protein